MRTLSLVVLLAACSSSSDSVTVDATVETIAMTCAPAVTVFSKSAS